jgi:menaquinone-dependent protoporphyrinogen oxidase
MHVLIAYGSKRGGTAGLATMIGDALTELGATVNVQPARNVLDVSTYEGVVVAGSLYAQRWHKDCRSFVRRLDDQLRQRPVWLASSGPLDDSARAGTLPPVKQVAKAAALVGSRGTPTFGGWMPPDAKGFPASAMAKSHSGDWRDPEHVAEFARDVMAVLDAVYQR